MNYPAIPEKCILDAGFEYRFFEGGHRVVYVLPNTDIQLSYYHQVDVIELIKKELNETPKLIFKGVIKNKDEFYKMLKELNIID